MPVVQLHEAFDAQSQIQADLERTQRDLARLKPIAEQRNKFENENANLRNELQDAKLQLSRKKPKRWGDHFKGLKEPTTEQVMQLVALLVMLVTMVFVIASASEVFGRQIFSRIIDGLIDESQQASNGDSPGNAQRYVAARNQLRLLNAAGALLSAKSAPGAR